MPAKEILVNVTLHEVRVALIDNGILQEIHIERSLHQGITGNIYKGRVTRLLPGIHAAFVDIGLERSAFLHISDLSGYEQWIKDSSLSQLDIRDKLRVGQDILVQVCKDQLGSKGPRLTTVFTIPSRYLVLTPTIKQVTVSQKIKDETERQRLMALITVGTAGGYIFRTVAEGVSASELERDQAFLELLWSEMTAKAKIARFGTLVHEEIPILLRVLRDFSSDDIERIRVDSEDAARMMRDFAVRFIPKLDERIEYDADQRPIFDLYSIDEEIQKALSRKVSLKSGGYLVFDQTEAMTTIDVNTGSYTGHNNAEQTIVKTNLEAIDILVRQVRLRNLGGIIIIDFIDMEDPEYKARLLDTLKKAFEKDSARVDISEVSSLGLVQLTRKRTRESLEHILCVPCPLCQQRGSIKSYATLCYEISRAIKRLAMNDLASGFLVIAAKSVVDFLMNEELTLLTELEAKLGKPVNVRVEASYMQEQYDILTL